MNVDSDDDVDDDDIDDNDDDYDDEVDDNDDVNDSCSHSAQIVNERRFNFFVVVDSKLTTLQFNWSCVCRSLRRCDAFPLMTQ